MVSRLVLVDLNCFLISKYHQLQHLTIIREGVIHKTGVFVGFCDMVSSILTENPETRIIFCKDRKAESKKELYPDYKANRKGSGESKYKEAFDSLDPMMKILSVIDRVQFAESSGKEADDVIAHLAYVNLPFFDEVIVYSRDSDFYQLIPDGIKVSAVRDNKKFSFIDDKHLLSKEKVTIKEYYYLKLLRGDTTDNIKPIKPRMLTEVYIELAKNWNAYECLETAFNETEKVYPKQIPKLRTAEVMQALKRNYLLIDLRRYRDPTQLRSEIELIKVKPDLEAINFYSLSNFRSFLQRFGI